MSQHDLLRLLELLRSADGLELVREVAERPLQELIGAEWGDHTDARTTWRNGQREKTVTSSPAPSSAGGAPSRPSTRSEWKHTSTAPPPLLDDLVKALGPDAGISKSEVSRIAADLDEQLDAFRARPLNHTRFPYLFLDATYGKARVDHRIVSQAIVIVTGVTQEGGQGVTGVMVGDSENEAVGTQFLRHLRETTHVILSRFQAAGKRPARAAGPPISGAYAW